MGDGSSQAQPQEPKQIDTGSRKKNVNGGNEVKYSHSSGKIRVSGGYKPGNMNAFVFAGGKKKQKRIKRGK